MGLRTIMTFFSVHAFLEVTCCSMVLAKYYKMQICIHFYLYSCYLVYPVMIRIDSHFGVTQQLLWKFLHQVARQHCYSTLLMTTLLPLHQNTDKKENNNNNNSGLAENAANASMVFASSGHGSRVTLLNKRPQRKEEYMGVRAIERRVTELHILFPFLLGYAHLIST